MPLVSLLKVGLWQTNVVSEDSRIFYNALIAHDGNYRVESLAYPVSMDANVGRTLWQTAKNLYRQQRRFAYGAENIPYLIFNFLKNPRISRATKFYHTFIACEAFHSWATNSLLIFLLGWLPLVLGSTDFNATILSHNLPRLTSWLMTIAMIGIAINAVVAHAMLLPIRPRDVPRRTAIYMVIQWALSPLIQIVFGSIPALDAQTRLMFGRYLGFTPTEKSRVD